jgi:hypothetical protein
MLSLSAAPAFAASSATISIGSPGQGQAFTTTSVPISGTAGLGQSALEQNTITDLTVSVTFGSTTVGSCDASACGAAVGGSNTLSTGFSYTPPILARNGPYSATAAVGGKVCNLGGLLGCHPTSSNATHNFTVAVPPAAPHNVVAKVNDDGTVALSWSANTEADLIGYQVQRSGPNGAPFKGISNQETTGFNDTSTKAGGVYGYVVIAVRPGATGSGTTSALTAISATATANVPVPAPPPTQPGPVVIGQNPAPTTTVTTLPLQTTPTASPDLSAFLAQATKAGAVPAAPSVKIPTLSPRVALPTLTLPAPGPPNTFAPTLPYGAAAPQLAAGTSVPRVALPGSPTPSSSKHSHSLIYYTAGGLVLCILGFAIRTANRRPRAAELEPLGSSMGPGSAGATTAVPGPSSVSASPGATLVGAGVGLAAGAGSRVGVGGAGSADIAAGAPAAAPGVARSGAWVGSGIAGVGFVGAGAAAAGAGAEDASRKRRRRDRDRDSDRGQASRGRKGAVGVAGAADGLDDAGAGSSRRNEVPVASSFAAKEMAKAAAARAAAMQGAGLGASPAAGRRWSQDDVTGQMDAVVGAARPPFSAASRPVPGFSPASSTLPGFSPASSTLPGFSPASRPGPASERRASVSSASVSSASVPYPVVESPAARAASVPPAVPPSADVPLPAAPSAAPVTSARRFSATRRPPQLSATPTVDDAVDYFRLLRKVQPPAREAEPAEKVDAGTPIG